jgi:hypothetical protein
MALRLSDVHVSITLLRCRYRQILRPDRHLAKFANGRGRHFDVRVYFRPHLIGQATKRKLERGDAFRFVWREGSPVAGLADKVAYNLSINNQ